jgi:hypothetical protein
VRDNPVDLCAMAIKDLMGPTVLNPGLHSRSVSSAPFQEPFVGSFISSCEGRSRDCAHDRSPPSIKL